MRFLSILSAIIAFVCFLTITDAHATDYVWDAGGDGSTWEDGDNWNP